ncbi:MAG: hypothetical protein JXB49_37395 [Bacteroidales bacterium]|nr:hypothetical protein [Bacteroidales bacterium]
MNNLHPDDIPSQEQLKYIFKYVEDKILLLKNIINQNPFPMAIWDNGGHFIAGNMGYQQLFMGTPPPDYSIFNDPVIQGWEVYESFLEIKKGDVIKFPAVPYNSKDAHPDGPDNPIWFETTITPLVNEKDKIDCYLFIYIDVTEAKMLEAENRQLTKSIIDAKSELISIISKFEEKKKTICTQMANEIQSNILPFIEKWKDKKKVNHEDIELLCKSLYTSPETILLKKHLLEKNLTLSEIKICNLIYEGYSQRKIAQMLSLTLSTVNTHSKNIRRKLSLKGSEILLKQYLHNI